MGYASRMTDVVDFAMRMGQLVRFIEDCQARLFIESASATPVQTRIAYRDMQAAIALKRRELQLDASARADGTPDDPLIRAWLAQLDKALEHTSHARLH